MKIALVTGSGRGIGFATGKMLSENGYRVVFSSRKKAGEISNVISSIQSLPNKCYYLTCDISIPEDRVKIFDTILAQEGKIDVLVNNAGVAPKVRRALLETTEESFTYVLGVNLYGTFFMCQEAAKRMLAIKDLCGDEYTPRIINVSSMSAYTSSTNRAEYCISKAGISMITKLFADELADKGIRVFEIRPGIIDTDMTRPVHEKYEALISQGITPIKRFGRPEDVAKAVIAACSGLMDFSAGQVLNVDGGFSIRRL